MFQLKGARRASKGARKALEGAGRALQAAGRVSKATMQASEADGRVSEDSGGGVFWGAKQEIGVRLKWLRLVQIEAQMGQIKAHTVQFEAQLSKLASQMGR